MKKEREGKKVGEGGGGEAVYGKFRSTLNLMQIIICL